MDELPLTASPDLAALLGYLNLAEGRPDPRFQKGINELYAQLAERGGERIWEQLHQALQAKLQELHQSGAAAFRDVQQAEAVLRLTFEHFLPAYRRHHADLLAHRSDAELWQPFLLARIFEAVLQQRGPWDETARIVQGAMKHLNDYVGHRPIATLESRAQGEPYDHERVRPIPLYLRGAGVAFGKYRELIAMSLDILEATDASLLRQAHFDPSLLEELALDPRGYDFDHPADKRPNYVFGEWDPHCIDSKGNYRRFALRQVTLDALWNRVENHGDVDRAEALTEAATVLAGTMLMASGVSGSGPEMFLSTVTLSTLFPMIAKYRDAFYNQQLARLPAAHRRRIDEEAKLARQPFGAARQALNQRLAETRALQLQHRRLALFFAELGDAAASRRQLEMLSVASARMLTELHLQVATGRRHVERGRLEPAIACLKHAEDLLERGIASGAFVDPWNILGFQGQYPRFQALEDSVRDHRVGDLTGAVGAIFDLYSRLLAEGADLARRMRQRAEWWDQFATTTVSDVPHLHGMTTANAAQHVAKALGRWRERGGTAGDLRFWKKHIADFDSPHAFATVIDALLAHRDFRGASALLIAWLSQADQVPLESGDDSFRRLALHWLLVIEEAEAEAPAQIVKFFDFLEANADDWWNVPTLESTDAGAGFPPAPQSDDGPDDEDEDESPYGAAYEGMTYRDSTDDGVEGEVLDVMPQKHFSLEHAAEVMLPRLQFLATVARLWLLAVAPLRRAAESGDAAAREALLTFRRRAQQNQAMLLALLDAIHGHDVPKPTSAFDAMVEFERRLRIKQQLLVALLAVCQAHAQAIGALREAQAAAPESLAGPPWEAALLALERHLRQREQSAARVAIGQFAQQFRGERLLTNTLDHGGTPRTILAAQNAYASLFSVVISLPRQGLLREVWDLLSMANDMEVEQQAPGRSGSPYALVFQQGLKTVTEAIVEAAMRDRIGDDALAAGLEKVIQPFVELWIQHHESTHFRLGVLEGLDDEAAGQLLVNFIRRYGRDLLTRRFLTLQNMSGVLHRGIGAFLDDLRENADPLHPVRLVEELDQPGVRSQAEGCLRVLLEALLENSEILRDYQQTCTQADFGDNLHLLLDFLKLKTRYERAAWNYRPLQVVHDVLVRRHPAIASEWREQVQVLTAASANEFVETLTRLEQQHGMRLATVRQRIEERFIAPLELDRLASLVEPAVRRADAENAIDGPSDLEKEASALAAVPRGVGLDAPAWLLRLELEYGRIRQAEDPLLRLAQARFQAPSVERRFAEMVNEFDGFESAAD